MKMYHVQVTQEDSWFIGRVLERDGVTTQGRSLDELVFMIRDAIELMWRERDVHLELILGGGMKTKTRRRSRTIKHA
jgi:predicted RNase H-like HicB family nuclease